MAKPIFEIQYACHVKDAEELATFVHIVLEQLFGIASRVASFRAAARI
jgi:hypothetical protein